MYRRETAAPQGSVFVFDERDAALRADKGIGMPRRDLLRPVTREVAEALSVAAGNAELDRDAPSLHPHEVVRRVRKTTCPQGRDGPGVHEQHPGDGPDVGHVP